MWISSFRPIVDFGLVVLIWMTQLIVYPSFLHFQGSDLLTWHGKYTAMMGYIVAPLMLIQLGFALFSLLKDFGAIELVNFLLVLATWVSTFAIFVPIHGAISAGEISDSLLSELVRKNWIRTVLWTVIFLLSARSVLS